MISLILLKLFTFSQILQGVPKLSHATVYIFSTPKKCYCGCYSEKKKKKKKLHFGNIFHK